jgi:hypothetical protein
VTDLLVPGFGRVPASAWSAFPGRVLAAGWWLAWYWGFGRVPASAGYGILAALPFLGRVAVGLVAGFGAPCPFRAAP